MTSSTAEPRGIEASTSDLPRISVIVPVFDDAEPLALCLAALEEQSYPRDAFEVIVVDNGSRPPITLSSETFPHVRIEREPRPGASRARATGIDRARGSILAFTDADCIPDPGWLAAGEAGLLAAPDRGVVGGRIEVFARHSSPRSVAEALSVAMHLKQDRFVGSGKWAVLANAFVKRSVVAAVGTMNPVFASSGEVDWCRRIGAAGYGIAFVPHATVRHPARHSIGQLCRRTIRLEHAWTQLRAVTGEGRGLREWLGQYVRQPLRSVHQDVVRNPTLGYRRRIQVLTLALGLAALRIGAFACFRAGMRVDVRRRWG